MPKSEGVIKKWDRAKVYEGKFSVGEGSEPSITGQDPVWVHRLHFKLENHVLLGK